MRILILGAGAIGGYLGGRIAAAGGDVTFLVRPARAARLAADGLRITSPHGDAHVASVETVTADRVGSIDAQGGGWDLIVLSAKAYDLASAIEAVRPAMAGGHARLLPLLNGMRHLDDLDAAFGAERVLGGTAHISTTLDDEGVVRHLNKLHRFTYGPRSADQDAFCASAQAPLSIGNADVRLSPTIVTDMWEKWVLLATLAGMTCLMRAAIGDIVATRDGRALILAAIDEGAAVAAASGWPVRDAELTMTRGLLTDPSSRLTSSMLRDLEHGGRIEAGHIVGDLVDRAAALGIPTPVLTTAYCHLQAYQAARSRT